jgi:hypothetical protein
MESADAAASGVGGAAVSGAEVGHACVLQQMAAGSDKVRCEGPVLVLPLVVLRNRFRRIKIMQLSSALSGWCDCFW